ncbi:MAG: hypothetical protein U1F43_27360 [Myxococcota bacterium]
MCGDDGCGGSCSTCDDGSTCGAGACICLPHCGGKACGDDGCGGSCGACEGRGGACVDGQCACTPSCDGKQCGDDGCGGSCGTCPGCFDPQPGLCTSDGTCAAACCGYGGLACGDDGCGGACGTATRARCVTAARAGCVGACQGKACGDDGCGAGAAPARRARVCDGGACGCVGSCQGKACGDDGCGASCGTCDDGERCDGGSCVCARSCVGKTCGDDGCGGSCGGCDGGTTCDATQHCACAPSCGGRNCGPDGCGGSCGECGDHEACGGDGHCACVADCAGKTCGDDGCGGSCGPCASNEACDATGHCACAPSCANKVCGDDGCGASCGDCSDPDICQGGLCLPAPDAVYSTFVGDWVMQPTAETTKCVVKRLSNASDIVVTSIHTTLAPGSHHMIVYRSDETSEKATPFDCTPFVETLGGTAAPLMITQVAEETLTFPPGVGIRLAAGQMVRIEAHYLNYFTEPITAHGDVEFHTDGGAAVTDLADFLFYGTTTFVIAPHSQYTSPWLYLDVPNGAKVFAITGHTHKYGTNVEARIAAGKDAEGTPLYPGAAPFVWSEAPVVKFDPPVQFDPGTGFKLRCTWDNTSGSYLYFGEATTKEMCFIWAYYYPTSGYRLCADGLFAGLCHPDN